jgi:hypothetical protein
MTIAASVTPAVAAAVAMPAIAMTVMTVEDAAAIAGTAGGFAQKRHRQNDAPKNGDEHPFHDTPLMSVRPTLERGMAQ